jgi:hypothetical protein
MEEQDFDPTEFTAEPDFEKEGLRKQNMEMSQALAGVGMQQDAEDQNLIHYQLETDKILERIEHFLKGDQISFGENGSYYSEPKKNILAKVKKDKKTQITYYIQEIKDKDLEKKTEHMVEVLVKIIDKEGKELDVLQEDSKKILERLNKIKLSSEGYKYISIIDEDKKPLNEYGVAELMRIMSMYITKETFLSYYSEERINEILGDLGDALNNFLYCNYEKMGMNTKFKESKYMLICINLLHAVESCYRRALEGNEQENIRTRENKNGTQLNQALGKGKFYKFQITN